MPKKTSVSTWLKNDPEQLAWAIQYLRKAGDAWTASALERNYDEGVLTLEGRRNENPLGSALVKAMRVAWNRQTSNRRNNKSTCSYSLEKPVEQQLGRLARLAKGTKSATLTALILRGFDFEQRMQEERRKALEAEKVALARKRPIRTGPDPNVSRLKREIASLNQQIEARRLLTIEMLYALAEAQIMRGNSHTELLATTPEELASVRAHHKDLIDHYEDILISRVGFPAEAARPKSPPEASIGDATMVPTPDQQPSQSSLVDKPHFGSIDLKMKHDEDGVS